MTVKLPMKMTRGQCLKQQIEGKQGNVLVLDLDILKGRSVLRTAPCHTSWV